MSKKIKQILVAIGAICIVSIAANIYLSVAVIEQTNRLNNPLIMKGDSILMANTELTEQLEKREKEIQPLKRLEEVYDSLKKIPKNKQLFEQLEETLKK